MEQHGSSSGSVLYKSLEGHQLKSSTATNFKFLNYEFKLISTNRTRDGAAW